jgi:hypothetical protein
MRTEDYLNSLKSPYGHPGTCPDCAGLALPDELARATAKVLPPYIGNPFYKCFTCGHKYCDIEYGVMTATTNHFKMIFSTVVFWLVAIVFIIIDIANTPSIEEYTPTLITSIFSGISGAIGFLFFFGSKYTKKIKISIESFKEKLQ